MPLDLEWLAARRKLKSGRNHIRAGFVGCDEGGCNHFGVRGIELHEPPDARIR
jgi:hypothetical protein